MTPLSKGKISPWKMYSLQRWIFVLAEAAVKLSASIFMRVCRRAHCISRLSWAGGAGIFVTPNLAVVRRTSRSKGQLISTCDKYELSVKEARRREPIMTFNKPSAKGMKSRKITLKTAMRAFGKFSSNFGGTQSWLEKVILTRVVCKGHDYVWHAAQKSEVDTTKPGQNRIQKHTSAKRPSSYDILKPEVDTIQREDVHLKRILRRSLSNSNAIWEEHLSHSAPVRAWNRAFPIQQ